MKTNNLGSYRIGIIIASFAIVLLFANIVKANNELSVTNLVISPQPVVSGENVTISFQIYNNCCSLGNINLGLSGNYPLLNYSPASTTLISSMGQGLYNGASYYFIYHVKIPQDVQAGTYTIYLTASYQISSTGSSASSTVPISFYISGTPGITVSAIPTSPIVPGNQFTADLTALNTGTAAATNVSMTLLNSANFSVSGASTFNLGTIAASASATAVATLQPSTTLAQGNSTIPILLKYTTQYGQNVASTIRVPISVLVNPPNLVPSIISTQPQLLYSGSNQTMTVAIQNIGTGAAKNVTIRFLNTNDLTVGGSGSDIFVGSIAAGSSSTQTIFLIANKNDNQTSYQLPVAISYSNANYQNTIYTLRYITVSLQPSAKFNITAVRGSVAPGTTYVPITFTIKNTGSEAAQQVTLSLQTIYPISPANPNVYINELDPGQSTNVTFYVNVQSQGNPGQYPITLYEQWTQPNGSGSQLYSGSNNYYATVASPSSGLALFPIVAIVAIVVIIGIVALRRMRFSKQSKK